MTTCPECAEEIAGTETICPYCKSDLVNVRQREPDVASPPVKRSLSIWQWVLIIVVVGALLCVVVLFSFLLLVINNAREAARRSQSMANLKQIGLALHNYHDGINSFPPGGVFDEDGRGYHGWSALLLPYINHPDLYEQIDFEQPWDAPANEMVYRTPITLFQVPGEVRRANEQGYPLSHYTGNERVLGPNLAFSYYDITDGTSNTIFAGEAAGNFVPWGVPNNFRDPGLGINQGPESFGSRFKRGCNILLMDGSVRFINEETSPRILEKLATPNAGDIISEY